MSFLGVSFNDTLDSRYCVIKVALNNMETGSEYMVKLKVEIEQEAAHVFATQLRAKEKIKTCLTDLLEISKQFKSHLQVPFFHFKYSTEYLSYVLLVVLEKLGTTRIHRRSRHSKHYRCIQEQRAV